MLAESKKRPETSLDVCNYKHQVILVLFSFTDVFIGIIDHTQEQS